MPSRCDGGHAHPSCIPQTGGDFVVVHNLLPAIPRPTPTLSLRVSAKDVVADGVVSVTLDHPDGGRLPDWTPGAHIDLVLPNGTTRQYSLCGDRWDPYSYRIAVLREPAGRGGSAYVHDRLMPGDPVGVGGTHNHFPLVPADRYLFIAGGIGITPLLPMIHQAELMGIEWQLLYGGRTRESMAFREKLAQAHGDRVHLSPQDEYGPLDLAAWLGEPLPGTKVYCCGPAPLLAAVQEACAHWPDYSLRTERFTAADRSERSGSTRALPAAPITARPGCSPLTPPPGAGLWWTGELYLPKSWTGDAGRCEAAQVPASRGFARPRENWPRAMILRGLASPLPIAWVTGDCAYGQEWRMRPALEEAGVGYVLAVPKAQHIQGLFSRIDQAVTDAPEGMGTPLLRRQLARSAMTDYTFCTIGKTKS
jgi:ferredoxin-NADP reductase